MTTTAPVIATPSSYRFQVKVGKSTRRAASLRGAERTLGRLMVTVDPGTWGDVFEEVNGGQLRRFSARATSTGWRRVEDEDLTGGRPRKSWVITVLATFDDDANGEAMAREIQSDIIARFGATNVLASLQEVPK